MFNFKFLLPENQPNENIYRYFEKFLNSINLKNWIILYVFFELKMIKDLGYDPDLANYKNSDFNNEETEKIKIENIVYEVPILFDI